MSIKLTSKERLRVYREAPPNSCEGIDWLLLKAQLKKVADWGDEPCPHVFTCRGKHWCGECWEALLKEIK